MVDKIIEYISIFLALMLVLPLHEFAHAFAAVKSGDITPKLHNRYTINPFAHFDVYGLVCFVLAGQNLCLLTLIILIIINVDVSLRLLLGLLLIIC